MPEIRIPLNSNTAKLAIQKDIKSFTFAKRMIYA